MDDLSEQPGVEIAGHVKWFDPEKAYGFMVPEEGPASGDVMVHLSVLRGAGFSTVAEGARIVCEAARGEKGWQAIRIISVDEDAAAPPSADAAEAEPTGDDVAGGALVPSRVKWFDKVKGFGFVNMHGDAADVFVHMEVLRRYGLPDLDPGEAVLVRAVEGPRGRMAAEVRPWDHSFRTGS